jgi:hypothetical protein
VWFQTRAQQSLVITDSTNASSTGKNFIILFF